MMLIISQIVMLVSAVLFLLAGVQEKTRFGRESDYVLGYMLLVLLVATMYMRG